jgi:general secretion pathway protein H
MTLIEVLVVMSLVALVVGSATLGFRTLIKSDLRSSASKLAASIRYLFDRASTTGKVHRLVLDIDKGRYWAEVSQDRFIMDGGRETAETRERLAKKLAKEDEDTKRREDEKAGLEEMQKRYMPDEFRPKRAQFSAFREMVVKPVDLKGGGVITDVFTPRLAEPLAAGRAYVYFFPLGMSEAAIIHLADKSRESKYSLIVHPLTGRVQIKNTYVDPPIERQFDDQQKEIAP